MHIQTTAAQNPLVSFKPVSSDKATSTANAAQRAGASIADAGLVPNAALDDLTSARAADVTEITRGLNDAETAGCTMPSGTTTPPGKGHAVDTSTSGSGAAVSDISDVRVDETAPTNTPPPAATMETLLELIGSWDTSNPQYDFTNDGVVNISDLMHMIRNGISVSSPGPAASEPRKDDRLSTAAITAPTDLSTADGVIMDSRPDNLPPAAVASVPAEKIKSQAESDRVRQVDVRAQKLVDSLIQRLNENGFEDQPPTNIRDLVSQLNLRPSQMNFVMHRLGEHYPMGLGVNLKV